MDKKQCDECKHSYIDTDDVSDPLYRCSYPLPFWVSLPVSDLQSWVQATDGRDCNAFQPQQLSDHLEEKSQSLGGDFARILDENAEQLYEK